LLAFFFYIHTDYAENTKLFFKNICIVVAAFNCTRVHIDMGLRKDTSGYPLNVCVRPIKESAEQVF